MKPFLTTLALALLSLPLCAQNDKQQWKELEQWGKSGRTRYQQGEEVKQMIREAEQRDASPYRRRQEPIISNVDILRMKAAGFSDDVILHTIETRQCFFDKSANTLIEMKQLGVSDVVIKAILSYGNEGLIPLDRYGLPTEIGVYAVKATGFAEIEAEPISWKDGGVWKSILTLGWTRGHVNAKAMEPRSRFFVERTNEIIIRTPEGVSPLEFLLVQLYEKDNRREFRFVTGGVIHRSSGAERTTQPFTYNKLAARVYSIQLPNLAPGEYGFLPTYATKPMDAAFVGKIHAFSIN